MMTTITEEQIGGDTPEQLAPLPPPSIRDAAGGQQALDPIAEEGGEDQQMQDTGNRNTEKEHSESTGARQKDKPVELVGLAPFYSEKLIGSRAFQQYCDSRKETMANQKAAIHFFHTGVRPENLMNDQKISVDHLEKSGTWFNEVLAECGLKEWHIKRHENVMLAKMAIVYKSAIATNKFDTENRKYCLEYNQEEARVIINLA